MMARVVDALRAADRFRLRRAAIAFAVFFAIALAVHQRLLGDIDRHLMNLVHLVDSGVADAIAGGLNYAAAVEVTALLMVSLAVWLRSRTIPRFVALAPLAFVASVPMELLLKYTVDQPVPSASFYRQTLYYGLAAWPTMQSFPSGHATRTAFMVVLVATIVIGRAPRQLAIPSVAVLGAIGLVAGWTRAYQGHHWPLDVFGGFVLGYACAQTALAVLGPAMRHGQTAARNEAGRGVSIRRGDRRLGTGEDGLG
jgi:undecaprenyl-diphosphatase